MIFGANFLEEMIRFMKSERIELAYSTYSRCDENLNATKIGDFEADTIVTFSNLLKTCRLSLLSSMYDSERVGKFYFPEGTKREDHVMWLELLKKSHKENLCKKLYQNTECFPTAFQGINLIL
jgi:hypothetical protein